MGEKRIIVDHMKISYEGLFEIKELYLLIDRFFMEKGFDRRELRNQEHVRPHGRYIDIELQPWKKITDYIRHIVKVNIKFMHIKDVTAEIDGHKRNMVKGKVLITLDGLLETDYEDRWEMKPFYFVIRTVFDKFIFKTYSIEAEELLEENVHQLHSAITGFLNMYRHYFGTFARPDAWAL